MTFMVMSNVLTCLCILLGVAFYTLLERKVLSYIQNRKGPKMVGIMGMLQPISDAVKLFTKEMLTPQYSNILMFWAAPTLAFSLAMIFWVLFPNFYSLSISNFSLMIFLVLSSLNVFGTMLSGWASNSKYSFLGSMRAMAQTISYEVSFVLIVFFPVFLIKSWNLEVFNSSFCVLILFIPLFFMFTSSIIAETNRAPFDFAEGESELVSGFNIEYGGGSFVLLFLAEYANILFMSAIAVSLFFYSNNMFLYSLMVLLMSVLFLFSRGAYPRLRYDLLMKLCWKCYLPSSMLVLLLILPII